MNYFHLYNMKTYRVFNLYLLNIIYFDIFYLNSIFEYLNTIV